MNQASGFIPATRISLIDVLRELRDLGNSVLVVEHEEEIMRAADEIIDMGPEAGRLGGEVVYQGGIDLSAANPFTYCRLPERKAGSEVSLQARRKWHSFIEIKGARENNLKNIDVKFPLHTITAVTGVSGSGKSSLVTDILYNALSNRINGNNLKPGSSGNLKGDVSQAYRHRAG